MKRRVETERAAALSKMVAAFSEHPERCRVSRLGQGNINSTYLVEGGDKTFVLQRIADNVFADPPAVIDNFVRISGHLRRRSKRENAALITASPVLSLAGSAGVRDQFGGWWRAQTYLDNRPVSLSTAAEYRRVGRVLADFHHLLDDLELSQLQEPLPGFHDLPRYLALFDEAAQQTTGATCAEEEYCLKVIARYRSRASILADATSRGDVTPRLVHGDPKKENFIGDSSGLACGLLDLDTVGAGLACLDLADCLRSCCNPAGEGGEPRAGFHGAGLGWLVSGYFSGSHEPWTQVQCGLLFDSLLSICFELGLRFFTDFLQGNPYFKVTDSRENVRRAAVQFRLAMDCERREKELRELFGQMCGP